MKIALHPMTADETGFVFEAFERSLREASTYVSGMRPVDVTAMLYALIDRGWHVNVAEDVEVEGYAVGWICSGPERNHLAWMFVKPPFRRQGVATQMLSAVGVPRWAKIVSPFSPNRAAPGRYNVIFRPYLVGERSSRG